MNGNNYSSFNALQINVWILDVYLMKTEISNFEILEPMKMNMQRILIFDYNCVHCILYARYNSNTKASDTKSYKQFNYIRYLKRNEHTSMKFVPNNRDNPDDFDIKGYVNIKSNKCYFTSNRSVVYQDPTSKTNVEIPLTEYGCCTIVRDDKDTKWIENLLHHIQINQINLISKSKSKILRFS
ncbi:hypothetical protein H8356DRAFT_1381975 [Neocallimastix lanati (nom. inval.)]|nr:hypothetical protein H8356DRAFT_1381975 [Neocallimastix sp. JGI-2020a]